MDSLVTIPISTPFNLKIVQVELTSKCTLKCPRCPRTELNLPYLNQDLGIENFKRAFTPEVLSQIEYLLFCGHTGDAIYAGDFLDTIQYIKSVSKTKIRITTNGSYKKILWWQALGTLLDADDGVTFSIDGWDNKSNNLYRINSDWDSIMNAISTLRSTSACLINWSAIYFKFNQDRIEHIAELAKQAGCDSIKLVKSSKFGSQYAVDNVDSLEPTLDFTSNDNNYHRESVVFGRRDLFSLDKTKDVHPWAKCLNGNKEINITVEGYVYPCGWFNTGYQQNSFVGKYQDRINIKTRSLKEILEDPVWSELTNNFGLEICQIKCKSACQ